VESSFVYEYFIESRIDT